MLLSQFFATVLVLGPQTNDSVWTCRGSKFANVPTVCCWVCTSPIANVLVEKALFNTLRIGLDGYHLLLSELFFHHVHPSLPYHFRSMAGFVSGYPVANLSTGAAIDQFYS